MGDSLQPLPHLGPSVLLLVEVTTTPKGKVLDGQEKTVSAVFVLVCVVAVVVCLSSFIYIYSRKELLFLFPYLCLKAPKL